ncbi:RHS repeat-associated core domain-containing protein [Streptomyces sp. NPDC060006]|uniref:RHS repeat-associated core domain-containing protein n=1 Tax=unclassified Streptomyces TaxID=2593676 RepID=UPI0036824BFE
MPAVPAARPLGGPRVRPPSGPCSAPRAARRVRPPALPKPIKGFLGKTNDTTTGLTHIDAREYDPTVGQFISVDPLLTLDQQQSLNGLRLRQ